MRIVIVKVDSDSEGSRYPYAWTNDNITRYTSDLTPSGQVVFANDPNSTKVSTVFVVYTPPIQGTGLANGRGVIYRITDESGDLCKLQWQELKTIRDSKALVADTKYRIVDYQCTTTQEDTQSAGHQFDIVLLALSENKLAEEGWAMMHDNIYDVTFSDGITKKCYIYFPYSDSVNVVIVDTLLGYEGLSIDGDVLINENDKTATVGYPITDFTDENIPYNYFHNSNLSAWKVWYCLDNDKDRFAWADDGDTPAIYNDGVWNIRNPEEDVPSLGLYGWGSVGMHTTSLYPKIGDETYDSSGDSNGLPIEAVKGFGRGVIYRLIDEWNNDVPYDFKNIQFIRPMTDGEYDADNGEDTWCYTFSDWESDNSFIYDISLKYDEEYHALNNRILSIPDNSHECVKLGDNV